MCNFIPSYFHAAASHRSIGRCLDAADMAAGRQPSAVNELDVHGAEVMMNMMELGLFIGMCI